MVIAAVIVWFLGGLIWSRVYFGRRHGVAFKEGLAAVFEPGELFAVGIGLVWPITIFTHRNPDWCSHRDHVLERERVRAEFEQEEARVNQALRKERGH